MATNSYGWAQPERTNGKGGGRGSAPVDNMAWNSFGTSMGMNRGQTNGYNTQQQMSVPYAPSSTGGYGTQAMNRDYPTAVGNGPTQASQVPGSSPFNFNGGSGADDILKSWNGMQQGPKDWNNPSFYKDEGNRNMMEGYSNYYAIPMMNAELAKRGQAFNEQSWGANFGEQQRMNTFGMGLQGRAADREDQAMNFGMETNRRDFGENQRQFNSQFGLQQEMGRGDLGIREFANQTDRLNAQNQYSLGQGQNANTRYGLENQYKLGDFANQTDRLNANNQYKLGDFANQTDRLNAQNQYSLGQGQNANTRYGLENQLSLGREENANNRLNINNQYSLGQGQLANDKFANQAQADRFQGMTQNEAAANAAQAARFQGMTANEAYANQTQRTGVNNQFTLGQGQLGFQNRELDVNEGFRRSQLAQEADLTREKYRNDMLNTRMQVQGRASGINQRAIRQWA